MKKPDVNHIIALNEERVKEMFQPYDPVEGVGSVVTLEAFDYSAEEQSNLPMEQLEDPFMQKIISMGTLWDYVTAMNLQPKYSQLKNEIAQTRCKYDFEFWAATAVKIKDKETGEDIPFILNRPQRRMLKKLEKMRRDNKPIRLIVLKARQWGGSTLSVIYSSWIQFFHRRGWNSAIIGEVENQAKHIRGMINNLASKHPKEIMDIQLRAYEGSTKVRQLIDRDNIIGVGSVQKPDNLRSYPLHMAHMSEVGLWKKTAGKSGEDLAQSVRASIPRKPLTMVVLESTAKGTGTFFHKEWQKSTGGESGYDNIFVPWHEIEKYREPIDDYAKFIESMDEYAWFLWEEGATLEGINWYYNTKAAENYDDIAMNSEYPSTADEAFQSTGSRVIPKPYVKRHEKEVMEPEFIGELTANAEKGKEAFRNIEFNEDVSGGRLQVWQLPDNSINVTDRYAVFMDIGGRTKDADYTVISVFDRYMLLHNGPIERVAVWRGHLDQDLAAWKAAQIAYWYNKGLLAVEVNSLKKKEEEGSHGMTILDEIAHDYDNLFFRNDPEKVKEEYTRYGFHTNQQSKSMIINRYIAALRDMEIVERYRMALNECDWFEVKENGSMGAVEGQHDDILITTAGATWLALNYMSMPVVKEKPKTHRKKTKLNTYADF